MFAEVPSPYSGGVHIALTLLSAIGAGALLVVGVVAMKWYWWDVAIGHAGEPDRSMLFWGLPILFVGILATAVGVGLTVVAIRSFRSRPE